MSTMDQTPIVEILTHGLPIASSFIVLDRNDTGKRLRIITPKELIFEKFLTAGFEHQTFSAIRSILAIEPEARQ